MVRVGIIGTGYFGKKIHASLKSLCDIKFFTGTDMNVSSDIDWVVIASSNNSHYELVKDYIAKGVNVFVEKPMTLSYEKSKELVELSKSTGVKLYIDDVFLYNPIVQLIPTYNLNSIRFEWNKYGSFNDSIFNNLTYHDIYTALHLGYDLSGDIEFKTNRINEKEFSIGAVEFYYNRLSDTKLKQCIGNGYTFNFNTNLDLLNSMLHNVFLENVDFERNNELALKTNMVLDRLYEYKPTVAVVGAGIFGITSALKLNDEFDVTLIEKNNDILQNASTINQYRLHRGYHYPRSIDTAVSAKNGTDSFIKEFPCEILNTQQHYTIASKNSKVNSNEYEEFMNTMGLEYTMVSSDLINPITAEATYLVSESLFDPHRLYNICTKKLTDSNVLCFLNTEFNSTQIEYYDYVVNCTYAGLNNVYDDGQEYQFEVCEKPIVKLSKKYKGMGVVVMDGPFMCIDPYSDTEYHVMGNVVHAIHETNIGKLPIVSDKLKPFLNKGVVKNPPITKFNDFIESAKEFLDMSDVEHIGSMFTIRTVLVNREHDDARPSIVKKHKQNVYSIFSGKISTAIDTANELYNYIIKS
jgi:hypothetical protein